MTDSVEQKATRILNVLMSTPFGESEPISRGFDGLPSSNAIYAVKHETEGILYVGKTGGLRERFTGGHKAFLWAWLED